MLAALVPGNIVTLFIYLWDFEIDIYLFVPIKDFL